MISDTRLQAASVTRLRRLFDTLDVDFPTHVAEAQERFDTVQSGASSIASKGPAIAAAAVKAMGSGNDPASDPIVQKLVVGHILSDLQGYISSANVDQVHLIYRDCADDILEALRGPFHAAADELDASYAVLGDVDLDDVQQIVRKGGSAADAWAKATTATTTIGLVVDAWDTLHMMLVGIGKNSLHQVLRFADVPPGEFIDCDPDDLKKITAWDVVLRGWTLSLADIDEHQTRIASMSDERQARAEAAPEKAKTKRPSLVPR